MEQLARLKARINNLGELQGIMHAMRGIAASRLREAHGALRGIDAYAAIIREGMAEAAALIAEAGQDGNSSTVEGDRDSAGGLIAGVRPKHNDAGLLIALCSEHGFVGAYNERVLDAVVEARQEGQSLGLVGYRGILLAGERHLLAHWTMPMAFFFGSAGATARAIAGKAEGAGTVDITFALYQKGGGYKIKTERILPVPAPASKPLSATSSPLPLHQLPSDLLMTALAGEYLYAQILRSIIQALTSENAARLAILQAADHNIGDKLEKLGKQARMLRQQEITTELMDVVTGAMAVAASSVEPTQ